MDAIQVRLDASAHPDEIVDVAGVLREYGIPADVEGGWQKPRPGLAQREGDEPEWIIALFVATFASFFGGFFSQAGADAWREFRAFARRLRDTRRRPTGPEIPPSPPHLGAIHFYDQFGNSIQEGIAPDEPPEAFWRGWQHVGEPDWGALDGWLVYWDAAQGTWAAHSRSGPSRRLYWDSASSRWIDPSAESSGGK